MSRSAHRVPQPEAAASLQRGRPIRRGAYIIPSLFTIANVFCGYFALTEVAKAGLLLVPDLNLAALHFDNAAKAIGFAVLFDGLDGRLARLMGTTSPFGQELDSLADTITFGIAPAFLAYTWGIHAVVGNPTALEPPFLESAGWVVTFLWVVCSAARLARFNTHSSAQIARSERPEHSKFVGMPTPASAGIVAAIVHFNYGLPMTTPLWVPFWLVLLTATSALMVSTWRYTSFKGLDFRRRRGFFMVVMLGTLFALIWFYSHVVLLLIASSYWLSGVISKLLQARRRKLGIADVSGDVIHKDHSPSSHHA
jgi:CDP-diacylglycerol--serine O-phosphatidyltransferase